MNAFRRWIQEELLGEQRPMGRNSIPTKFVPAVGKGIGEAWDLSVHENGLSRIRNGALAGRSLAEVVAAEPEAFGGPIELLAKRLDCREDLSVQVHPTTGDPKTEAWVVLQAREGAGVYHGDIHCGWLSAMPPLTTKVTVKVPKLTFR